MKVDSIRPYFSPNLDLHETSIPKPTIVDGIKESNPFHKTNDSKDTPLNELPFSITNLFLQIRHYVFENLKMKYYFLRYNLKEITKQKLSYSLGFLSCLLVIISILITLSALGQMPIVILRIAELERGQFDVKIRSNQKYGNTLNYTRFEAVTNDPRYFGKFSLSSPRITITSVPAFAFNSCPNEFLLINETTKRFLYDNEIHKWMHKGLNSSDSCSPHECVKTYCDRKFDVTVTIADSHRDKKMGLGRKYTLPTLNNDEIYISKEFAYSLELEVGDVVILQLNSSVVFGGMYREVGIVRNDTESWEDINWNIYVPMKVAGISNFEGRVDWSNGVEIGMIEFDSFVKHLANYVAPEYLHYILPIKEQVNLYDYARNILINLPNRVSQYNNQDYDTVRNRIAKFAAEVAYLAGFDQINMDYPVIREMETLDLIGLFLNLIVNVIIVILVGISVILIYGLLLVNVESRTFEMGVLRMVGMNLWGLVQLIFVQSLVYSVPAIFVGITIGQLLYIFVSILLEFYLEAYVPKYLSFDSVLIGMSVGFVIPLLGSILPIKSALGKNLNDSLNTTRSKTKAVEVSVESGENETKNMSWNVLIISIFFFGFGFSFYYFMPLALISMKLSLLLFMFFSVILMMLVGMIMLSLNFESIVESIIVYLLFFWEKNAVRQLVLKNLIAHRVRNRKSTIMYGVSLAFIIFITISFAMEIDTYKYDKKKLHGTRLNIKTNDVTNEIIRGYGPLKSSFFANLDYLIENGAGKGKIAGYAYKSWQISKLTTYYYIVARNLGNYAIKNIDISAISPNFYELLDTEFLKPTYIYGPGDGVHGAPASISRQLYSERGSYSTLIPTNFVEKLGIDRLEKNFIIELRNKLETENEVVYDRFYNLVRPNTILEGAAASSFSKFSTSLMRKDAKRGLNGEDIFVSFPMMKKYLEKANEYFDVDDIPIKTVYIKFNSWVSESEIAVLKSEIKKCYNGKSGISMVDLNDKLRTMDLVDNVMNIFFYLSSIVTLILCFFSLISNMFMNIKEQSKEIAILRAIGCRRWHLYRIYIYEALVLIYTASLIGIVVGSVLSYTMILQQSLFTQLPINVQFPYVVVLIVVFGGVLSALCASFVPIYDLLKLEVVSIFRAK